MNSPQTFLSPWGLSTRYDLSYTIFTRAYVLEYTRGGRRANFSSECLLIHDVRGPHWRGQNSFKLFWPLKSHFRLFKIIKAVEKQYFGQNDTRVRQIVS